MLDVQEIITDPKLLESKDWYLIQAWNKIFSLKTYRENRQHPSS